MSTNDPRLNEILKNIDYCDAGKKKAQTEIAHYSREVEKLNRELDYYREELNKLDKEYNILLSDERKRRDDLEREEKSKRQI